MMLEEAAHLPRVEEERLNRLAHDQHRRNSRIAAQLTAVVDRWAHAGDEVLLPVRRRLDRVLLTHLGRARVLPRLPKHLASGREGQPALTSPESARRIKSRGTSTTTTVGVLA